MDRKTQCSYVGNCSSQSQEECESRKCQHQVIWAKITRGSHLFEGIKKPYVNLLVESYNNCLAINPSNPLAVARNIEKMATVCELLANLGEVDPDKPDRLQSRNMPDSNTIFYAKQILADIKKGA